MHNFGEHNDSPNDEAPKKHHESTNASVLSAEIHRSARFDDVILTFTINAANHVPPEKGTLNACQLA
jgi:hypothetical protein